MERQTVVKAFLYKVDEVRHRVRRVVLREFQNDFASLGADCHLRQCGIADALGPLWRGLRFIDRAAFFTPHGGNSYQKSQT